VIDLLRALAAAVDMLTAALLDRDWRCGVLRCDALGSAFLPKRRAADSLPALAARRNTDAASFWRHRYLGEWGQGSARPRGVRRPRGGGVGRFGGRLKS
jgi:hypothetical protein